MYLPAMYLMQCTYLYCVCCYLQSTVFLVAVLFHQSVETDLDVSESLPLRHLTIEPAEVEGAGAEGAGDEQAEHATQQPHDEGVPASVRGRPRHTTTTLGRCRRRRRRRRRGAELGQRLLVGQV